MRHTLLPRAAVQPQYAAQLDRSHPLGAVLDHVFLGTQLDGRDIAGGMIAPPPSSTVIDSRPQGRTLVGNGTAGTKVAITGVNKYPIIVFGYGYFGTSANNWELVALSSSGLGYSCVLRLQSSSAVEFQVQFNYGTLRSLSVTVPAVLNVPFCMIGQILSETDQRFYVNGQMTTNTSSPGTLGSFDRISPPSSNLTGGLWASGVGVGRSMPDAAALAITANPSLMWGMFL